MSFSPSQICHPSQETIDFSFPKPTFCKPNTDDLLFEVNKPPLLVDGDQHWSLSATNTLARICSNQMPSSLTVRYEVGDFNEEKA